MTNTYFIKDRTLKLIYETLKEENHNNLAVNEYAEAIKAYPGPYYAKIKYKHNLPVEIGIKYYKDIENNSIINSSIDYIINLSPFTITLETDNLISKTEIYYDFEIENFYNILDEWTSPLFLTIKENYFIVYYYELKKNSTDNTIELYVEIKDIYGDKI